MVHVPVLRFACRRDRSAFVNGCKSYIKLNALTDAATNAIDVEKTSYYAQAVVRTSPAP